MLYINRNRRLTHTPSVIVLSVKQPNSSIEQVLIFRPRISSITSTVEQYASVRLMHIDLRKSRALAARYMHTYIHTRALKMCISVLRKMSVSLSSYSRVKNELRCYGLFLNAIR